MSALAAWFYVERRFEKIFSVPSVKDRIRARRFLDSQNDYFNGGDR